MADGAAAAAAGTFASKHTFDLKQHWSGPSVSVGADVRFYLRIVVTLLLIWRLALTVVLAVTGRYDLTMYTYWSHTLLDVFYALLWISLWFERWTLTFSTLFVFPVTLGSTFLVAVSIVIIIQENEDVFTAGTSTGLALSLIHTGDWVLHSLPVIELLLILVCGYLLYARAIIASEVASLRSSEWKAAYVLYWILSPLVLMLVYSLVFNPSIHYPTGIPTYILWLGLAALDIFWMSLMYFVFTASASVNIVVNTFFSKAVGGGGGGGDDDEFINHRRRDVVDGPPSTNRAKQQQQSSSSQPSRIVGAPLNTRGRRGGGGGGDVVVRMNAIDDHVADDEEHTLGTPPVSRPPVGYRILGL